MNVEQIRQEVGPAAAKLAEKYLDRTYRELQEAKYNLELARQMQQAPRFIKFNKTWMETWGKR
jgi:hypothetical protein